MSPPPVTQQSQTDEVQLESSRQTKIIVVHSRAREETSKPR